MTKNQKLALADLLRTWRHWFGDNWFTTELAIQSAIQSPWPRGERDLLREIGIENEDGDELSRRLDELCDKVIYHFIVKRDAYMQVWRVLLVQITDDERNDRLSIRTEAGSKIDPETAEVDWWWGQIMDPYGLYPDLPEVYHQQTGRLYWARSPGSDIWVEFGDLPAATRDALEKSRSKDDDFPWLWLKRD